MLSYGKSMSLEEAREYAERRGLSLISGEDIVRYAERLGLV
jgi:3,4-dihydroxy-2-butanone 4-phosphate synthase